MKDAVSTTTIVLISVKPSHPIFDSHFSLVKQRPPVKIPTPTISLSAAHYPAFLNTPNPFILHLPHSLL